VVGGGRWSATAAADGGTGRGSVPASEATSEGRGAPAAALHLRPVPSGGLSARIVLPLDAPAPGAAGGEA